MILPPQAEKVEKFSQESQALILLFSSCMLCVCRFLQRCQAFFATESAQFLEMNSVNISVYGLLIPYSNYYCVRVYVFN